MPRPVRSALVMLLAGLSFLPVAAAGQTPDQSCHEVKLTTRPGWTISGSWSADGSTVKVVDLFRNEVLQYSDRGDYLGVLPDAHEFTFDFLLPNVKLPGNLQAVFQGQRAVEAVSMPVALFGWEDHLYVVGRHARERRTQWSLTKIDPRADKVLWTVAIHLPFSTRHVTVVPGPRYWAWIEKGMARGLFDQDVERILFLPSALLRNVPGRDLCQ